MNKDLVNYKNLFISKPLMEISLTWRCIIGWDSYYVFQTGYTTEKLSSKWSKDFLCPPQINDLLGQQGKSGYLPIIELTCYNLLYCVSSQSLSLSLYTFLNKKILGYEVVKFLDHVLCIGLHNPVSHSS